MDTNINTCTCTTNITTIGLSGKELAKKMQVEIHCMDSVMELMIYCGEGAETQVLMDIYRTHRKKLEELMIQMDNYQGYGSITTSDNDLLEKYGFEFGSTKAVPIAPYYNVSCRGE